MKFEIASSSGRARSGEVTTRKGTFATPCFMPVGTRAGVRSVSTSDIEEIGFQLMLANTYHLMLRPGAEIVGELGGISRFSSFSGSVLTDSGGFQVFSLKAKYDEEGVSFKSVYDGS
ncbi:MAG TPA: tRNA-guanine transglycosylase, partial [Acidimicrobiales bacterium]|nr:tRNA-guanine transglycosylase [Acidimicrobiales bacterium]